MSGFFFILLPQPDKISCGFGFVVVGNIYAAEAFSIHIKRKLQEQDNMNVMQVYLKTKQKKYMSITFKC